MPFIDVEPRAFVGEEQLDEPGLDVSEGEAGIEVDVVVDDLAQPHEGEHPALEGGASGGPLEHDVAVLGGEPAQLARQRHGRVLDVADDQIDPLLDEGWRPEDVALLTTGARHPEQVALQESEGQEGYWQTFWDKDCVFYGHVLGCKGLERKVVVLCVNERMPRERSRERLYVGLSRATDKLVVVGPADVIREMGGHEVAKRLGIT